MGPLDAFPDNHSLFLDLISDGVAIVQSDGTITTCNDHLPSMLGLEVDTLKGRKIGELLCQDSDATYQKDKAIWSKGISTQSEWAWTAKGVECVPTIVSAKPLLNSENIHTSTILLITDITLRKKSEEELRERQELYLALVNATPDGVLLTDSSLNILMTNAQALDLFGVQKESELLDKRIIDLVHPKQQELLYTFTEQISPESPIKYKEITLARSDDSLIPIELSATSISQESEVNAIVWYLRDLSEKYKTKQALRQSEQRFRTLFENSPTAIFILDTDGLVSGANSEALNLFGLESVKEIIGFSVFDRIPVEKSTITELEPGESTYFRMKVSFERVKKNFFPSNRTGYAWLDGYIAPRVGIVGKEIIGYILHCIEVTDRVRAEEALKTSEDLYRNIFSEAGIGISYTDEERKLYEANSTFLEMLGYSPEEFTSLKVDDITHPDDLSIELALHKEIFEGKRKSAHLEKRWIRKDGSIFWARLTISLMNPFGTEKKFLVGIIEDITERYEQREALRKSEQLYRNTFETIRDGIVYASIDGYIENANPAYLEMLGYTLEELRELKYQEFTPSKWFEMEKKIVEEDIIAKGYSKPYQKEYIRKDGTVFPVEIYAWLMRDHDGNPLYMFGLVRDITEEKKLENERKEIEEKYHILVDTNPEAMALITTDSKYLLVNKQLADLHGFDTSDEMIGMKSFELVAEEDREKIISAKQELLQGKGTISGEFQLLRKDGTEFPAIIKASAVKLADNKESGIVAVVHDITDQLLSERQRKESEQKFRTIFNASPIAMVVAGYDGIVKEVNRAFIEIFGYEHQDIKQMKMHEFFSSPKEYQEILGEWYKKKHVRDYEISIRLSDEKIVSAQVNMELENFEGIRVMIVAFRIPNDKSLQ